jgi:hypothetical protein
MKSGQLASLSVRHEPTQHTPHAGGALCWIVRVLVSILIIGGMMAGPAFAQTAQLSGVVTDPSGARIANANVTVLNKDTGITRQTDSNADGYYAVPLLQVGNYMVTVKAAGFATQVQSNVTLDVGQQQVLNFSLKVGNITQTVQVTEEAPVVELASSSIGGTVESTTVRELPLNGRSWSDLATLQPGIVAVQTQNSVSGGSGGGRALRGYGNDAAISGARPQQNNYRIDGVSINDYGNGSPGSVLGGNLGVDAVEEFSVLTSNYSAEYGRTSGGVVNAATRSGTNQFHGGAYEFLRNSVLDARNFFDPAQIPAFKRNQFGVSGGGPIRKDRTFIFADYEGIRQSKGIARVDTVPSASARNGILGGFSDPAQFPSGCTPISSTQCQVTVDSAVQKYLPLYATSSIPRTRPDGTPDPNISVFTFAGQQVFNENFFVTRVDHKISDKDNLSGTYTYDNAPFIAPDNLDTLLLGALSKRQLVSLAESHTFNPSFVNVAHFGFNRVLANGPQDVAAINPLVADKSLAAVPGQHATWINVPGITPFQGGLGRPTYHFRWNSFQVYDDFFVTKSAHSLKFGLAVERMQLNALQTTDTNGIFTFGSLSQFLQNQPNRFDAGFPNKLTERGLRQTLFGVYAQDDWRLKRNLALNLGLRYEITTVPTEVQGKLATLINITDAQPHLGNPYFHNPTLHNLEPRVGFAWDPFGDGKTAVRGGFGLFDVLPLPYEVVLTVYEATPFFELGSAQNLSAGTFPAGAFQSLGPSSVEATFIEQHPRRNYVMQRNLNIQRQIAPNLVAMIGYVGSRGVHQPSRYDDTDIVLPTLTPVGYLWPVPNTYPAVPGPPPICWDGSTPTSTGCPWPKLNTHFGSIRTLQWSGDSYFNALEAQITKRMTHGLQLQGSFTWGKSIDTGSSTEAGNQYSNSISSEFWPDLRLSRGLSDFNITRALVISGTWEVPSFKSLSGPAGWITNGWELGAIYKANDGVPFTPTFGTDGDPLGLSSNDPWDFPNRLSGSGCQSLINPGNANNYVKTECFAIPTAPAAMAAQCVNAPGAVTPAPSGQVYCINLRGNAGRNILIGPGLSNLDFSIYKNNRITRISENFNVQFRAEFFNILNHPNFAVPVMPDNTDIFDSTGAPTGATGLLTSTTTTSREIQFALKILW